MMSSKKRFSFMSRIALVMVAVAVGSTMLYFKGAADMTAKHAPPNLPGGITLYTLDIRGLASSRDSYQTGDAAVAKLVAQMTKTADKAATQPIVTVTAKSQTPPSGDTHDYMSLANYWWPDPSKPDGVPYIRKDGKVNPETNTVADKTNFNNMLDATGKLAIAYYFSGNQTYAQKAAQQLRAWFVDPSTRMNPNLNYAQMIKGRANDGTGLIDLRYVPSVLDYAQLISASGALSASDIATMKAWFSDYRDWLIHSDPGKKQAQEPNNHGTWYNAQVIALSSYIGDTTTATQYADRTKKLIDSQIAADGSQPLELERTNSWDYSILNLEGLLEASRAAQAVHVDLLHYTNAHGVTIQRAASFLTPYVTSDKAWPYEEISEFKKDKIANVLPIAQSAYGDSLGVSKEQVAALKPDTAVSLAYPYPR
jgi:hypothetical protein